MKIVITGGTGMIGTALSRHLAENGHSVTILSRKSPLPVSTHPQIQFAQWDGRTVNNLVEVVNDCDAVVNLAGANLSAGRWSDKRKKAIITSRVNAGLAITKAIQESQSKPSVLIQASGVGSYGISESGILDETAPYGKDFLAGVTREWENSTAAVEQIGVRRVITRLAAVLDSRHGAFPLLLLPFRLFAGGPLGSGNQWLAWIHISDAVRAIRYAIESPSISGIVNLAAVPVRNSEFARTAGKILKRPSFFRVPAFMLKLVLGEMSLMVLEGQNVKPTKLEKAGFSFEFPTIDLAIKNLINL